MTSLADMMRKAKRFGRREARFPGYGSTPNVEELPIEQIQMQALPEDKTVLMGQLAEMAKAIGATPTFNGDIMDMGQAGRVDMSNADEVASFMDFASDAMPEAAPSYPRVQNVSELRVPQDIGGGVATSHPGQVMVVPQQRPGMRELMEMGIGGAESEVPSARVSKQRAEVMGQRFEALVSKLGMDPQTFSIPKGADFSTLTPQERWLARQLGVYPRKK